MRRATDSRAVSLAGRLSLWLAIQIACGLLLLSATVYLLIAAHLETQQAATLRQMQALVQHMFEENGSTGDRQELFHQLDDFVAGHDEFSLELTGASGRVIYSARNSSHLDATSERGTDSHQSRTITFKANQVNEFYAASTVRLTFDRSNDANLLQLLAWILSLTSLIFVIGGTIGARVCVRRVMEPLADLDRQLRTVNAATLQQRLDGANQPRELQPMVERFNELLARLDTAYAQMAAFNADVAHELKTPLATLVTSTELALRDASADDDVRELLGSNLEDLQRLDNIVRSMLFLATAERGAMATTTRVESLMALVAAVVEYHEAALEEAGLQVRIEGDASASIDVMLIRQAVSNLLGNATRHARSGSEIRIECRYSDERELSHQPRDSVGSSSNYPSSIAAQTTQSARTIRKVALVVENQGDTIAAEHLQRLFDRFYKVRDSGGSAENSSGNDACRLIPRHGLGLAIVAAIARMHGGRTIAQSEKGTTRIGFSLPMSL